MMKARHSVYVIGLTLCAAASGGCTKSELFNKMTGRPSLPQQQVLEENPEYRAQFMQRRRPINNPPSDGDPRYTNNYGESMLSVPAMQSSAPPAGYPGGLPPVPRTAGQAYQGGTATPQFSGRDIGGDRYRNVTRGAEGQARDMYGSPLPDEAGMSAQGMPMQPPAFSGGGGMPPGAAPSFPPPQGNHMQQGGAPAYQGTGGYPAAPGGLDSSGSSYRMNIPGMRGGYDDFGGPGDFSGDMGGAMPLQLDGGTAPGGGDMRAGGMTYRAGVTAAPQTQNMYGRAPAPIPQAPPGGVPPYASEPYASGPGANYGGNYGNAAFRPSPPPPSGAESRIRYATRNKTAYYRSLMDNSVPMPSRMSY